MLSVRGTKGRLLVDKEATPEQRRALEDIFSGKGKIHPAGLARLTQDLAQPEYADVKLWEREDGYRVTVNGATEAVLALDRSEQPGRASMEIADEWRGPRTFGFASRFRWVG